MNDIQNECDVRLELLQKEYEQLLNLQKLQNHHIATDLQNCNDKFEDLARRKCSS